MTELVPLDPALKKSKTTTFRSRAKLYPSDYEGIIAPFQAANYNIVCLRDVFEDTSLHGQNVLFLRHDVDHDYETALRIGEWEAERGLKSTFCMLHTAWYYGEFDGERYHHSIEFIDACKALQDMGHEINLHNNLVAMGLQTPGLDVSKLLQTEMSALRAHGLEMVGTSAHGDALCGKYDFINLEVFKDRTWDQKGGDRTVVNGDASVELGSIDGLSLGLIYEAYDYPRDLYISDSGGRPRMIRGTRGQRGLRKDGLEETGREVPFPSLCGILTHPIWWDFETTTMVNGSGLFRKAFRQHGFSEEVLLGPTPHEPSPVERLEWAGGDGETLEAPRKYGLSHDEIVYRAPVEIKRARLKQLITDKEHFKEIGDALSEYVLKNEPEVQQKLHGAFMASPPSRELLAEFVRRNMKSFVGDQRWTDVSKLAIALSLALGGDEENVIRAEQDRVADAILAAGLDALGDNVESRGLLAVAFKPEACEADTAAGRLAEQLGAWLKTVDVEMIGRRAELYAVGAALAARGGQMDRLAGVLDALLSDVELAKAGQAWPSGEDGALSAAASVSLALLLHCVRDQALVEETLLAQILAQIDALMFSTQDEPRAVLASDGAPIAAVSERAGGYGPILAWRLISCVSEAFDERVRRISSVQEFGDWFRSANSALAYGTRFARG